MFPFKQFLQEMVIFEIYPSIFLKNFDYVIFFVIFLKMWYTVDNVHL